MEDGPPKPPGVPSGAAPGFWPPGYGAPAYPSPEHVVPPQPPWSRAAIVAFVLNLTPCGLFLPGIVLGLVGLRSTGGHQRRGRWMAITALVLPAPWLLLALAIWAMASIEDNRDLTESNARAGMCMSFVEEPRLYPAEMYDPNRGGLLRTSCGAPHDGEIYAVLTLTAPMLDKEGTDEEALGAICDDRLRIATAGMTAEPPGYSFGTYHWVPEGFPARPGDFLMCILQDSEHRPLQLKVLP